MERRCLVVCLLLVASLGFGQGNARSAQFLLGEKPLNLGAYLSQTLQFSLKDPVPYDTEKGLQQALTSLFVEADFRPRTDLIFYASSLTAVDWVYELKSKDDSWREKGFSGSRDELYIDDAYWQLLKEAHITWTPGNFYFRVGKQIVSWGEMDFFRIMDQINPLDNRRGFSDVEFESTVIPIWLVRAEWWPRIDVGWLEELGFQFVFNPNADFIADQGLTTGNDAGGIWAAAYRLPNPLYPYGLGTPALYVGALEEAISEPDAWDEDGFEYGVRISARIRGGIVTLNGFYGRENAPVELLTGFRWDPVLSELLGEPIPLLGTASDGTSIIYPTYAGKYPRQKFVGVTWTADLPFRVSFLGGVNPLLRAEVKYQFDKTFKDMEESRFYESDFLDTGWALDWKVKIGALNPRAYFTVSPQFFFNRILDYPSDFRLYDLPDENYYVVTLYLATSYVNGKLVPDFAWAWDTNNVAHLFLTSLTYSPSNKWDFTVEACFMQGQDQNRSMWLFRNKDYMAFKVKYNWG